jgi:hypothetical protein
MILDPLPAVETGGAGGFDDGLKIPVIRVAEDLGKSLLDQYSLPAGFVRRMDSKGVISWFMAG